MSHEEIVCAVRGCSLAGEQMFQHFGGGAEIRVQMCIPHGRAIIRDHADWQFDWATGEVLFGHDLER